MCIVRGENDECACLCNKKVCSSFNKKQPSSVCKVHCKAQANNAHTKYTNPIDKKVKLFSSGRPPQQESYSPTERHTHTLLLKNLLGLLCFAFKGRRGVLPCL